MEKIMWRQERINKMVETLKGRSFHVIGACAKEEDEA